MAKTCFVICPIGEDGSDTRRNADDLFEIVVKPVLLQFGFTEPVRADKIPTPGTISNEIVSLIQTAELCIIDLTDHNANVYYECGRRHETGKPFIQLIRKGQQLPFDLAGIRTIFYDLSSARSAHEASLEIQKFVGEFEKQGYGSAASGVSLSTLASAVERIDRKLEAIRGVGFVAPTTTMATAAPSGLGELLRSPEEAFMIALANGQLEGVIPLLPRMRRTADPTYYVMGAGMLAQAGYEAGAHEVEWIIDSGLDTYTGDQLKTAVGSLARYHIKRDTAQEMLDKHEEQVKAWIDDSSRMSAEDRAFLSNQLGILYSGLNRVDDAERATQRAVDLAPSDIAYKSNLAIVYERQERFDRAEQVVDAYMRDHAQDLTSAALEEAIDVYLAVSRLLDARAAFDQLASMDPQKAQVKLMFTSELRQAVG